METRTLGNTGMETTVMGLGTGGFSRIGTRDGDINRGIQIVREALELGIRFIDTSEAYGTETAVGRGMEGFPRQEIILSTKMWYKSDDKSLKTPAQIRRSLEESLKKLGTDYIDVYHVHAVPPEDYTQVRERIFPVFQELKKEGVIRAIAISEMFGQDTEHQSLSRAVAEDPWDVIMIGYNMLNLSALNTILQTTRQKGIGVLDMFAVRKALISWSKFLEFLPALEAGGLQLPDNWDPQHPGNSLFPGFEIDSLPDLAYRFVRQTPGIDVVLSGTGDSDHLKANFESLNKPPLPAELWDLIKHHFGNVSGISGQ